MVSKTQKFRGSRTHGRGKKAGRGAGKHGGHGNAGLHKHKYIHMLKFDPMHFGRHGFKTLEELLPTRMCFIPLFNVEHLLIYPNLFYQESNGYHPFYVSSQ